MVTNDSFAKDKGKGPPKFASQKVDQGKVKDRKKPSERDPERDSIETYKDLTKLLISLATGTLVLSVTILGFLEGTKIVTWWSLYASSSFLLLSVSCGILVLSTLAGSQHANVYNIDDWRTRLCAIPQWVSFFLGLIFMMIFIFKNLKAQSSEIPCYMYYLICS